MSICSGLTACCTRLSNSSSIINIKLIQLLQLRNFKTNKRQTDNPSYSQNAGGVVLTGKQGKKYENASKTKNKLSKNYAHKIGNRVKWQAGVP